MAATQAVAPRHYFALAVFTGAWSVDASRAVGSLRRPMCHPPLDSLGVLHRDCLYAGRRYDTLPMDSASAHGRDGLRLGRVPRLSPRRRSSPGRTR
jgi:hypothetical protein